MKKLMIISLLFVSVFASGSYGAMSEDIYLRRDVFDARMDRLERAFNARIEAVEKRINLLEDVMSASFVAMDRRISDLRALIYFGFSILGFFIALITFAIVLGEAIKNMRKPAYATLEDVKRLIAESKLEAK